MNLIDAVNGAVGPYDEYCDGTSNSGASVELSIGILKVNMDTVLDKLLRTIKPPPSGPTCGINMRNATSFNGTNGAIWDYHLAKADALQGDSASPLSITKRHDGKTVANLFSWTNRHCGRAFIWS